MVGMFVGAFLMIAGTALAEEITSFVGKTVQGEYPVTVDGKQIGDSIIVEGSSFLPVRSFGESLGYKVEFHSEEGVILTSNKESVVESYDPETIYKILDLDKQIQNKKLEIKSYENRIKLNEGSIKSSKESGGNPQELLDFNKQFEAKIVELQEQLAELEHQKETLIKSK